MLSSFWNPERLARLSVSACPNLGASSLIALREHAPSWEQTWSASRKALLSWGVRPQLADSFLEWRKTFDLSALLRQLEQDEIRVVFPGEPGYPTLLSFISDPPQILFQRGTLADHPTIAMVGTRRMTAYGKRCVREFVPQLVELGFCIVSGLAFGVDGEAHRIALERHGTTWAVLGTGIDEVSLYPRAHAQLAHDILAGNGALISEFPPGTGSRKEHFPLRNRIIAGLSQATLVIEAQEGSGSLITAKSALEENREVLAVPGPLWSEVSRGTNRLIRAGARVCLDVDDVLAALHIERPAVSRRALADLPTDPIDHSILAALDEPKHADRLAEELNLATAHLTSRLSLLELSGVVASLGGQVWARAGLRRQVRQKG